MPFFSVATTSSYHRNSAVCFCINVASRGLEEATTQCCRQKKRDLGHLFDAVEGFVFVVYDRYRTLRLHPQSLSFTLGGH